MENKELKTLEQFEAMIGQTVSVDGGERFDYLTNPRFEINTKADANFLFRHQQLAVIGDPEPVNPVEQSIYFIK